MSEIGREIGRTWAQGPSPRSPFIPLEQAWEDFTAEDPATLLRPVDICDACQRIRTKFVKPDFVCERHTGRGYSDCLARYYESAQRPT